MSTTEILSFGVLAVTTIVLAIFLNLALKQRDTAIERRHAFERGSDVDRAERERLTNRIREDKLRIGELECEVLDAHNAAQALQAAKVVVRHVSANRMPDGDVRRAFAVDATAPLWRAVHQELDDAIQKLVDIVDTMPSAAFPETARLHVAGGLSELRDFQKQLLLANERAAKDADLDDDDDEKTKGGQGGAS